MKIIVIEPQTPEEFKQYFSLRYEILRKPWGQPKGSERDEGEETSIHRMIIDNKTKVTIDELITWNTNWLTYYMSK